MYFTWISFSITGDSIGINEVLKAACKLVSSVERRRNLSGRHVVEDRGYRTSTCLLKSLRKH